MRRSTALVTALMALALLLTGCRAFSSDSIAPIVQWRATGGPGVPVMRAIAGDPVDPSVIYAGLSTQGIFRSPDGGQTWQKRQDGVSEFGDCGLARAFYISQAKPGRVYAAFENCGVYETQNGGERWEPTELVDAQGEALDGNAFLSDGVADETLYLATGGGIYTLAPGATQWMLTPEQPGGRDAVDVWAQALAWDSAGRLVVALDGAGVWASSDRGQSWQPLNDGLADAGLAGNALALDGDNALLLGTWGGGIYRLAPGASVWQPFADGLPPDSKVYAVIYVPQHETVYASLEDHGLYRRQKGRAWEPIGPAGSWWALSYHQPADALYIGSALEEWGGTGGALRSDDRGQTWTPLALPQVAGQVRDLIWLDAQDGVMLAATALGRTYRSNDRGQTWQRADEGLPDDVAEVTVLYRDEQGIVYGGAPRGNVWRSHDRAATWEEYGQGLPKDTSGNVLALVAYDDGSGAALYAGLLGGGIYRRKPGDAAWQKASNGLRSDPPPAVSAFLADHGELLASVSNTGVHRYLPGEDRWQLLSLRPDEPFFVTTFAASGSHGLGQLITGSSPKQQAVGENGIYRRGREPGFQRVLPGLYQGLAVDVAHPQVLFTGVFTDVNPFVVSLDAPRVQSFETSVSLDNGKTWQLGGPLAEPIRVLLADPKDASVLYAGTGQGVYIGRIDLPILWREVAAWAFLAALMLLPLAFLLYAFLALTLPYDVPLLEALRLLLFHRRELATVLADPSALSPVQQIILAETGDRRPWQAAVLATRLDSYDAYVSKAQLATALAELAGPLHLVRMDGAGNYRLVAPGLSRLVRRRIASDRSRLARAVREENEIYREAREFFRQAGFAVFARRDTLLLQPLPDGLWALEQVLGQPAAVDADSSLVARLVTSRNLDQDEVNATLQVALDSYDQQVVGRLLFLVVAGSPDGPAYRRLAEIRRDQGLTIVLISHAAIHRALQDGTASGALLLALRRARGELKVGMLSGPVFDPLDFFDRTEAMQLVRSSLAGGSPLIVAGARQVGKTSLVWQVIQGLSDYLVAYIDLQRPDLAVYDAALYAELLRELVRDGAEKYPQVEWPLTPGAVAPTNEAGFADLLDRLSEAMLTQTLAPRVALVIDGLSASHTAWWSRVVAATQTRLAVGLVGIWSDPAEGDQVQDRLWLLRPFDQPESQVMVESMASQASINLGEGVLPELHRQSGGHPLLLRQLFGLAMSRLHASEEPGQLLAPGHVNGAVADHVATSQLYSHWWRDWSPAQQRVVFSLASGAGLEPDQQVAATSLERIGWLIAEEQSYRIAAGALQQWLNSLGS